VNRAGVQLILNSMARYPEDIGVIDYSGSALANILREIEGFIFFESVFYFFCSLIYFFLLMFLYLDLHLIA
jgi:hypothetical protein